MKKFEVCVRSAKRALFEVEAVDSATAQDAALALAEDHDWTNEQDDWPEIHGVKCLGPATSAA